MAGGRGTSHKFKVLGDFIHKFSTVDDGDYVARSVWPLVNSQQKTGTSVLQP